MDVKLRSLVCLGLNEQVLHLWWEILCSAPASLQAWYSPTSLTASPGWVLVKCELRILAQFSFNLSHDWELPQRLVLVAAVRSLPVTDCLSPGSRRLWL